MAGERSKAHAGGLSENFENAGTLQPSFRTLATFESFSLARIPSRFNSFSGLALFLSFLLSPRTLFLHSSLEFLTFSASTTRKQIILPILRAP